MKLSETQQDLLDAMKSGVTVHGVGQGKQYFYRTYPTKGCTSAARALIKKGYAAPGNPTSSFILVLKEQT